MNEGNYQVMTTHNRHVWQQIPFSERIFVDGGALIVYDNNDTVVAAYGPGEWAECLHNDVLDAMFPVTGEE